MTEASERVYEVVDIGEVPLDVWRAGQRALRFAEQDLGLSGLRIVWIREVATRWEKATLANAQLMKTFDRLQGKSFTEPTAFRSGPLCGQIGWYFNDGVMRVRCDLSPEETIRTVAHEVRHINDSQHFRPPRTDEESTIAEQQATAYEQRVWTQLADGAGAQRS